MVKRKTQKRIIRIDGEITSQKSYKNFKKEFPDLKYDRKLKVYTFPKPIIAEIKRKKHKIKKRRIKPPIPTPPKIKKRKPKKKKEVEKEIEEEIEEEIPSLISRRQIVLILRGEKEPYAMNIRAITTNPNYEERALKSFCLETLKELGFSISHFSKRQWGHSNQAIPSSKDEILKRGNVLMEVLIKRNSPIYFIK